MWISGMTGQALTTQDSVLNISEVESLLAATASEAHTSGRIDLISKAFIGRPYAVDPLGGGPGQPESLTAALEAFDCVTYIEAALALALSRDADGFLDILSRVRYENGEVDWRKRNHYMTDWARNNEQAGFVRNVTDGPQATGITRRLSVVEGLPAKHVVFQVYRKQKIESIAPQIVSGDLILFASARRNLDFFHTGLLIARDGEILLRHATRSAGLVIEQPLSEFLGRFRMSGFALLRPVDRRAGNYF